VVHFKLLEGLAATQQQELLNRLKVEWTYTSKSKYDLSVPALNRKTTKLVMENLAFEQLKNFFEQQYDNTKKLVKEIKLKK
jgi:hypothetical protein